MPHDIDRMPVSDVSKTGVSRLVRNASEGRRTVLTNHGRDAGAFVDMETLGRLQDIDELETNARLLTLTLARMATAGTARYSLDDVLAEHGIDA